MHLTEHLTAGASTGHLAIDARMPQPRCTIPPSPTFGTHKPPLCSHGVCSCGHPDVRRHGRVIGAGPPHCAAACALHRGRRPWRGELRPAVRLPMRRGGRAGRTRHRDPAQTPCTIGECGQRRRRHPQAGRRRHVSTPKWLPHARATQIRHRIAQPPHRPRPTPHVSHRHGLGRRRRLYALSVSGPRVGARCMTYVRQPMV